jgi:hypothetical protein
VDASKIDASFKAKLKGKTIGLASLIGCFASSFIVITLRCARAVSDTCWYRKLLLLE